MSAYLPVRFAGKFRDRLRFSGVFFIIFDLWFVLALNPHVAWEFFAVVPLGEYRSGVGGAQGEWAVEGSAR